MTYERKKISVTDFIDKVWNRNQTFLVRDFLCEDFHNHSLPPGLGNDIEGLARWVELTSSSFEHHTTNLNLAQEDDQVFIQLKMSLKHIGSWRGSPCNRPGARNFRLPAF